MIAVRWIAARLLDELEFLDIRQILCTHSDYSNEKMEAVGKGDQPLSPPGLALDFRAVFFPRHALRRSTPPQQSGCKEARVLRRCIWRVELPEATAIGLRCFD